MIQTRDKTLFLAWQNKEARKWYPIGRMEHRASSGIYRFQYIRGAVDASENAGFKPLFEFPDLYEQYESTELFPLLQTRLFPKSRGDFHTHLEQLDLTEDAEAFDILEVDGGYRATDSFHVFPLLKGQDKQSFTCRFFLHGFRHITDSAQKRIGKLNAGEELGLAMELANPETTIGIQIQSKDYEMLGWAPRYLRNDLQAAICNKPEQIRAHVVRLNPEPAPIKQRLLVAIQGAWPDGHVPMSTPRFDPLP
ncbi:MAG: hypothetical protein JKY61_06330 [Planctomycetes bacterium]|nr:hypothetical protein [Planctomycetota bacterium]